MFRRLLLAVLFVVGCDRPSGRPAAGPSVTDAAGRAVTLPAPATRIVSLLPSFTELLFAIGAGPRVVGRTAWCDYPPAARAVPSVGEGLPPNVEAVAARRPDLVVLYHSSANLGAARQLERLGIAAVLLDLNRLEELGPAARTLGRLTGLEARAESLAAAMDEVLHQPPPTSTSSTSLAFIVWDNPPIVIGRGSYLHQLAERAGARNVFGDIAAPSAQVALETIAVRDPDWLAVLSDSAAPSRPAFAARREWRAVRAVREERFLMLDGSRFGRPGPRSGEAIRELRARLAP